MKSWILIATLVATPVLAQSGKAAQSAGGVTVTPLTRTDLHGVPGKEATLLEVRYAPGGSDPIHRHDAHVFVYVLEGSIVMQVRGKPSITLKPGQTFQEVPDDVHVIGRNASKTTPARFLVFFVKDKGVAPVLPAK